ncbi:PH domain-containing protein [Chryseobacterium sp.]|uniref:PH domain-containing protein n=1 Tax=Chryseobacterium sp. TaxID=1871047 RepID=UPI00321C1D65
MQNLKYQIKYINPGLLSWASEDIEQLPDILMEDEKIIHIIDGVYEDTAVLLFSTDQRMIFKGQGIDFVDVIPLERIVSIQYMSSAGIVEVETEEKIFKLNKSDANLAQQFCKAVNVFLKKEEADELSKDSIFELLERLGKLKESGILTPEEFTEQKLKLLDKL